FTQPQLGLVVDCPPAPGTQGELVFYSGVVSNAGDVALSGVLVTDDKAGFVTQISGLAPAETADFFGMYFATDCGPAVLTAVTTTALDICTGAGVSNQVSAACPIVCVDFPAPVLLNPRITGSQFRFSFDTTQDRAYTVEFSDAVRPTNWQTLT